MINKRGFYLQICQNIELLTLPHAEGRARLLLVALNSGPVAHANSVIGVTTPILISPVLTSTCSCSRKRAPAASPGVASAEEGCRVKLPPQARSFKITLKLLCRFSFVKPMHQEWGLADERADPSFMIGFRLMGSAQETTQGRCLGVAKHFTCLLQWSGSF